MNPSSSTAAVYPCPFLPGQQDETSHLSEPTSIRGKPETSAHQPVTQRAVSTQVSRESMLPKAWRAPTPLTKVRGRGYAALGTKLLCQGIPAPSRPHHHHLLCLLLRLPQAKAHLRLQEGLAARPGTPSLVLVGGSTRSGPLTNVYSLTLRGTLCLELECVSFMLKVTPAPKADQEGQKLSPHPQYSFKPPDPGPSLMPSG